MERPDVDLLADAGVVVVEEVLHRQPGRAWCA